MNSFSKDSSISFLTEISVFIFGFISSIILARYLGPTGRGIYSLAILIPGIMLTFGNFGVESSNVYFVGSKKYKIEDAVSNSLILAFFLGFILIIIFWLLLQFNFFQKFIQSNQISPIFLWITVAIIPFSLLLSFLRNAIRGVGEITNYNKIRLLENFLQLVAIFSLVLLFRKSILGAVSAYAISIMGAVLFTIFLVKRLARFRFSLNKKLAKESFLYGGKVYVANALSFLNYRSDMFFLAFFLTPAAVGFYSLATGIAEQLFMIPGALATVLFPRVSSISNSEANDFTPKIVRHTFFIMLILSLLLSFLARPLVIIIFGLDFLPSVIPLILLLPGIIAFGVGGVLAADLGGRGKPQFAVYSSLGCLIIDTILNFILIPRWGVSGASIASSISYSVDTLMMLIAFLKVSKKSLVEVLLIKKEDFKDYIQIFFSFRDWIQAKRLN